VSDTLIYSGELLVETCWCGIRHAIPAELRGHQLRQYENGQTPVIIYCPLGHPYVPAGEPEVERLRRIAKLQGEARAQAEASARAYKGAATRARKRSAVATCPCCNRSFVQLRRHLATKHPDYTGAVE
jgi:hypothetical protein